MQSYVKEAEVALRLLWATQEMFLSGQAVSSGYGANIMITEYSGGLPTQACPFPDTNRVNTKQIQR